MAYKYVQYENGKFQTTDEGGGGGGSSYSTTEHEVGTWIDGSTIYEITIDLSGGALYNNIWNNDWYIDGSYIDKIINVECVMHIVDNNTTMQFAAPFYIRIQNGYMLLMVSDPSSAYSFYYTDYLTIRYTKVTASS